MYFMVFIGILLMTFGGLRRKRKKRKTADSKKNKVDQNGIEQNRTKNAEQNHIKRTYQTFEKVIVSNWDENSMLDANTDEREANMKRDASFRKEANMERDASFRKEANMKRDANERKEEKIEFLSNKLHQGEFLAVIDNEPRDRIESSERDRIESSERDRIESSERDRIESSERDRIESSVEERNEDRGKRNGERGEEIVFINEERFIKREKALN